MEKQTTAVCTDEQGKTSPRRFHSLKLQGEAPGELLKRRGTFSALPAVKFANRYYQTHRDANTSADRRTLLS